jgi:hypothetical protein
MCGQFHFLTKRKEPILRTRRRICTFLSEFTKFRLLPQSIAFNCLKKCVKDFTGTNIDMTCYLLESSGRFLYLQPESHARMKHLVTIYIYFYFNVYDYIYYYFNVYDYIYYSLFYSFHPPLLLIFTHPPLLLLFTRPPLLFTHLCY